MQNHFSFCCYMKISFMQKYGYLYKGSLDSEALYHETAITEAIKNVQKYGALEQTGILDNDTLKVFALID